MPSGLGDLAELEVDALHQVRGVDDLADLGREPQERGELLPRRAPHLDDPGVTVAPLELEGVHGIGSGFDRGGGVDRSQGRGDGLAVLPAGEAQRRPDEVDHTGLHQRLRPRGLNGVGQALEPVATHDQHVLDAAVADLGEDRQPEFGALTAVAQPHAEHVLGRTIIRCARLRACAHGGQIVLSSSAAALVADDPGEVGLIDLGTVRLRDLSRPERVWQAVAPRLPVTFPPLRSLDVAPHNLPTPLTSFVGREAELAAVAALLREERLVTLTGSGGCGKTRLALHAAAEMVDAHPGGTWWVDLAPVTTAEAVVDQVAGAVGTVASPGADSAAAVVGHLRDRGATLVVVDNAEHLVEAVAELVDVLVSQCPDVRLLVTSREPLGVDGELVWRVPSLSVPPRDDTATLERLHAYESARL